MVEEGSCPQRVIGSLLEGSVLSTILLLTAFSIGVFSSSFLRAVFGILFKLNHRKSSTVKTLSSPEELPKLPDTVPKHVAVIMDGNRRFGRQKHADALQGHWAGGQTLVDFIQWCMQDGLEIATVYAFSTENWNRDPGEVSTLMSIFAKYAESLTTEASTRNVRVRILATDFEKLPPKVQSAVAELERSTAECTGFLVNICLSYGSRAEIVMACNSAIDEGERERERRSKRGITEQPGCTSESMLDGELSDAQHLNGAINQNRSIVKGCTCRNTIDLHDTGELNASDHVHVAAVDSDVTGCNNKDKKSNSRNGKDLDSKLDLCDRNHHMNGSGNDSWGFSTNSGNSSSSSSVKNSRHQSTSSPCSCGGMDDESKNTLRPKSSSFQLDEATLSRHMCTAGIPDPDILIRTSGEFRISNFLLWQMAYTEMFFIDKYWPEITHRDLREVLQQFHDRQRRFGV